MCTSRTIWRAFTMTLTMMLSTVGWADGSITINGQTVVRDVPDGIGGVNINAHSPAFATNANGINFQADLAAAGVGSVRSVTFPDYRQPTHDITYFDRNVTDIINSGAQPLLTEYINPPSSTLKYYTADGKLDGTGTVASNAVYIVKRYTDPNGAFKLPQVTLEVGNEPDITVDYQTTKEAYTTQFNAINDALVAAGVRDKVKLAGPVMSYGYKLPYWNSLNSLQTQWMDYFLQNAKNSVDIVSLHNYEYNDSPQNLLNEPQYLDTLFDTNRPVTAGQTDPNARDSDRGMASLLAKMNTITFGRPNVGIAITEHNLTDGTGNTSGVTVDQSIYSALWNLALQQFMIKNPRGQIDNLFLFDDTSSLGVYTTGKAKNPNYWALYLAGRLRGTTLLGSTTSGNLNSYGVADLLVTATSDSKYLYLEVLNRAAGAVTDSVNVNGLGAINAPTMYVLSATQTPDVGTLQSGLGASFSYAFPAYSDTVFRYALVPEPTSLAMIGIFGLTALGRRWSRKDCGQ